MSTQTKYLLERSDVAPVGDIPMSSELNFPLQASPDWENRGLSLHFLPNTVHVC